MQFNYIHYSYLFNKLFDKKVKPKNKKDLLSLLEYGVSPAEIDVSKVEDLSHVFENSRFSTDGIESWDVSHVKDMSYLFSNINEFKNDISSWDVSSVEKMEGMFRDCTFFNQDLSKWNISHVTTIADIFHGCSNFNKPLNTWNTENITNFDKAFSGAFGFNQNLKQWKINEKATAEEVFSNFNQSSFDKVPFKLIIKENDFYNLLKYGKYASPEEQEVIAYKLFDFLDKGIFSYDKYKYSSVKQFLESCTQTIKIRNLLENEFASIEEDLAFAKRKLAEDIERDKYLIGTPVSFDFSDPECKLMLLDLAKDNLPPEETSSGFTRAMKARRKGSNLASLILATYYYYGLGGVKRDRDYLKSAKGHLINAASTGDTEAVLSCARFYEVNNLGDIEAILESGDKENPDILFYIAKNIIRYNLNYIAYLESCLKDSLSKYKNPDQAPYELKYYYEQCSTSDYILLRKNVQYLYFIIPFSARNRAIFDLTDDIEKYGISSLAFSKAYEISTGKQFDNITRTYQRKTINFNNYIDLYFCPSKKDLKHLREKGIKEALIYRIHPNAFINQERHQEYDLYFMEGQFDDKKSKIYRHISNFDLPFFNLYRLKEFKEKAKTLESPYKFSYFTILDSLNDDETDEFNLFDLEEDEEKEKFQITIDDAESDFSELDNNRCEYLEAFENKHLLLPHSISKEQIMGTPMYIKDIDYYLADSNMTYFTYCDSWR